MKTTQERSRKAKANPRSKTETKKLSAPRSNRRKPSADETKERAKKSNSEIVSDSDNW